MGTAIALVFCLLLGAWIVQSIRNEFLAGQIREMLRRAEAVIGVIEGHNRATDAVADRVVAEVQGVKRDTVRAAVAACEVRDAIANVPDRVAEKLASDSATENAKMPVIRPQEGMG